MACPSGRRRPLEREDPPGHASPAAGAARRDRVRHAPHALRRPGRRVRSAEYMDWKSGGDTNFAPSRRPTASSTAGGSGTRARPTRTRCGPRTPPSPHRSSATSSRSAPTSAASGSSSSSRRTASKPSDPPPRRQQRFNPDAEGWVVRSWVKLTDNTDSYMLLMDNGPDGLPDPSTEARDPLHLRRPVRRRHPAPLARRRAPRCIAPARADHELRVRSGARRLDRRREGDGLASEHAQPHRVGRRPPMNPGVAVFDIDLPPGVSFMRSLGRAGSCLAMSSSATDRRAVLAVRRQGAVVPAARPHRRVRRVAQHELSPGSFELVAPTSDYVSFCAAAALEKVGLEGSRRRAARARERADGLFKNRFNIAMANIGFPMPPRRRRARSPRPARTQRGSGIRSCSSRAATPASAGAGLVVRSADGPGDEVPAVADPGGQHTVPATSPSSPCRCCSATSSSAPST